MLKIGQLAQIKSDSPYVYEALTQLVNGVNAVGRATGVDPSGGGEVGLPAAHRPSSVALR